MAVGTALGVLPVWLFARKAAVLVRRSIGGRPATVGEFPRLHNVVDGLCLTNGIDTRTWGIDFSAAYPVMLDFGRLDLTLTANYNKTKITDNKIPAVFSAVSESYIEDASPDYKVVAGFLFKSGAFSLNARETFYGKTTILVTPSVSCSTLTAAGQPCAYDGEVKPTAITDLEASYAFTDNVTFSVGANNLFDKRPEKPKLLSGVTVLPGQSPYENGTTSWNSYYGHGAYGSAGGYYYARLDFKF